MDLYWRMWAKASQVVWSGRRWWHRARFVDFRNQPRTVHAAGPGDDAARIQVALDECVSTDTAEYQEFLRALRVWQAKSYRLFVRRPHWLDVGEVRLSGGQFRLARPLQIHPRTKLYGASFRG